MEFHHITNHEYPYINVAHFLTRDNKEVILDRTRTGYSYDEKTGKMSMDWSGIYIWDGENENFDIPDGFLNGATLLCLEVEDDAPEGYEFRCVGCNADGENIQIQNKKKGNKEKWN